ncbi:AAEL010846-PA, partial [Aedes aegypti]
MVDFMYYGEVNVSTEQLPQVLKTAEMLKIKGLAEMPDASAVCKADPSKLDHPDLVGAGLGPGGTGGPESIWGSAESQQQQAAAQQQQQQQQYHQQLQAQQPQLRRTPSPTTNMSPAARRKRLRKTSTGSAGNNIRIIKESPSSDVDQQQHESSQESVDESGHHIPSIIVSRTKCATSQFDLSGVTQTIPMDISATSTSVAAVNIPQSQSQHSGECLFFSILLSIFTHVRFSSMELSFVFLLNYYPSTFIGGTTPSPPASSPNPVIKIEMESERETSGSFGLSQFLIFDPNVPFYFQLHSFRSNVNGRAGCESC